MKQKATSCVGWILLMSLALACDEGGREESQIDTSESDSTEDTATSTGQSDSDSLSDSDTGDAGDDSDTADAGPDSGTGDAGVDSGTGDTDTDTDSDTNTALSPEITTFQGLTHFILRGIVVTPFTAFEGEVLTSGNEIVCVDTDCSSHPDAAQATVIETHGIIFPGMIDSHNHIMFDVFDEDDWEPAKLYEHHDQWTSDIGYQAMKDCYDYLLDSEALGGVNIDCEVVKYGEIKGLIVGTTSILGAPKGSPQLCFQSLARSIDGRYNDLPETARPEPCTAAPSSDHIQTAIALPSGSDLTSLLENFDDCSTWSYVVHVGEGIPGSVAINEWTSMKDKSLDVQQSTVVHGTAFDKADFEHMASKGMKLVWSPQSNKFLYNQTTRIDLAITTSTPLTIALAPDWSLGGSANILEELHFAYEYDQDNWGGVLGPEDLVEMVTINAAKALEIDQFVGSLEVGKLADLFVIAGDPDTPHESLIQSDPSDVSLVMVDGKILFGDKGIEAAAAFENCEDISICGTDRFLCVAEPSTDNKLNQTFDEIVTVIQTALQNYDDANGTNYYPVAPVVECL